MGGRQKTVDSGQLKFKHKKLALMFTEVVAQGCSIKKVFLEISQNSEGFTCDRVSFLTNLQALSCINIPSPKLTPIA